MNERLYTTEQAAARLGIPAARIADWKHRGRVFPVSEADSLGRGSRVPLYLLEDLIPLADAWAKRSATRREKT